MTWQGKKVSVVGLGKSNTALIKYLMGKGASVIGRDQKSVAELGHTFTELAQLGVDFELGADYLKGVEKSHTIFLTPGMPKNLPEIERARARGVTVSSETNLFFELCRAPIIGVTGSSGKTTTTSLIGSILEAAGHEVYVGGNIGRPLIDMVEAIPGSAWVVLELSSFQLELLRRSPTVAVITNISPNHLDIHKTMEHYLSAKENIIRYQGEGDLAILNWDDLTLRQMAKGARGRVAWFSMRGEPPEGATAHNGRITLAWTAEGGRPLVDLCAIDEIKLLGAHNVENVLAACAVGYYAGVTPGTIRDVVTSFTGVAHRLELVREAGGVAFYNDSIATSPARAVAGLMSFDRPVWLIAGGYDKKLPFDEFAEVVLDRAKGLLLIGETAPAIEKAVAHAARQRGVKPPETLRCSSLEEAVVQATRRAVAGDVVLLSPACASYDMFAHFEERGERFIKIVHALTETETAQTHERRFHGL